MQGSDDLIQPDRLGEEAIHAALWDYAQKNNITIEGLKPPVNDIDETEEFYKMKES